MTKNRNKNKPLKKIVISLFVAALLIFGGAFAFTFWQLSKINTVKISDTNEDLGISDKATTEAEDSSGITNIAFFGIDARNTEEPSRSDSIIILSVDTKDKKIKMSSIMRDTYVTIKGHGKTKINSAYAYGGPQLAIRTLNENFNLNVRNYVTVDFFNLEKIINSIGGVTVDVDQNEVDKINGYMQETAKIEKKLVTTVKRSGSQTLNGMQAVAYTRIRYLKGDDFKRTERQRTVLTSMLTKIQSTGATKFPSVVSELLPLTETSMGSMDIVKLGTKVIASKSTTLEQGRFPADGDWSAQTISGASVLVADMEATIDKLHKFIYQDIKPENK
ncbi:LCP family protein [Clostridium lacusfryxellense]|uniref:LCP family protein n=1 Tax=Clostridium lacusfryxellense TaxID=205328 RepID=UPI001C0D0EF2|nr:LCP family protein [Clostridium lacusfryxellense]MBU3111005.1 LCP family protein [Clostridium lacusfryxellense]